MRQENNKAGCFIAFEGIDGSGKTTQANLLKQRLLRNHIQCYTTNEPTDSPIGSVIHQIMTGRIVSDNKVVAALFVADRLDHLLNPVNGMYANIMKGVSVIADRYYFSSYAYNSIDIPLDWVIEANSISAKIMRPTVTIFVDVDPDEAIRRISKTRYSLELYETRERLALVREKYYEAFERLKEEETIVIVNGEKERDTLEAEIWQAVKPYF